MREVSELVSGMGAGMGQTFCLFVDKSRQRHMKLVGADLQNKHKKMALHATGSRSVDLLTKGCYVYEKFTWIQGEFTEEKSTESY